MLLVKKTLNVQFSGSEKPGYNQIFTNADQQRIAQLLSTWTGVELGVASWCPPYPKFTVGGKYFSFFERSKVSKI